MTKIIENDTKSQQKKIKNETSDKNLLKRSEKKSKGP